jgi:hypothetical protein
VSSNAGEHAHQEHCKAVFENTNRHPDDWQRQMMMYQCRQQASAAISREMSGTMSTDASFLVGWHFSS